MAEMEHPAGQFFVGCDKASGGRGMKMEVCN